MNTRLFRKRVRGMFVLSFKASRRKIAAVCGVLLLAVVVGSAVLIGRGTAAASAKAGASLAASSNEERVSYLQSFGWEVEGEPAEIVEVAIPTEFNEVYQNYNNIQKKQGFDLTDYKGKKCKRWTYTVTNYPDVPEGVKANLLTCGDKIIGGDICSTEMDGFMHGFEKN